MSRPELQEAINILRDLHDAAIRDCKEADGKLQTAEIHNFPDADKYAAEYFRCWNRANGIFACLEELTKHRETGQ